MVTHVREKLATRIAGKRFRKEDYLEVFSEKENNSNEVKESKNFIIVIANKKHCSRLGSQRNTQL